MGLYPPHLEVEPDPADVAVRPADLVDAGRRRRRSDGGLHEVRVVLTRGSAATHLNLVRKQGPSLVGRGGIPVSRVKVKPDQSVIGKLATNHRRHARKLSVRFTEPLNCLVQIVTQTRPLQSAPLGGSAASESFS